MDLSLVWFNTVNILFSSERSQEDKLQFIMEAPVPDKL